MNAADTAWVMTATALVLLMTLPGLALFYAGLVQVKNILSVLMQCVAVASAASLLWFIAGYSLAFGEGNAWIGDFSHFLLSGIERDTLSGTVPESGFSMFQMTFAVITPALMIGAFVERIKFSSVVLICSAWLMIVYVPVTHWVWGGGWLGSMGIIDFAGGIVVHVTAGVSAAVIAFILGARTGFPNAVKPPHAPWMVMVGASLLWVGWFGFNGGSALAANGDATMAILVTHLSASTATLVWVAIERVKFGKPSLVGAVTGTIAGLATITPASGSVGPLGGVILGLVGGVVCYIAVDLVKGRFKIDDSLDVLAVHGVGGATGTILVALLLTVGSGAAGASDLGAFGQLQVQVIGVVAVAIWSLVATYAIVKVTQALIGLRVSEDDELAGLDQCSHGETGYNS